MDMLCPVHLAAHLGGSAQNGHHISHPVGDHIAGSIAHIIFDKHGTLTSAKRLLHGRGSVLAGRFSTAGMLGSHLRGSGLQHPGQTQLEQGSVHGVQEVQLLAQHAQ